MTPMGTEVRGVVRGGVVVPDSPLDEGLVVTIRDTPSRPKRVNEMAPGERIAWLDSLPGDPITFEAPPDLPLDPDEALDHPSR